jgi:D-alanine-D-alanine ligase
MTRKYNHVAVLMGGLSAEREVSLNSGAGCAAALEEAGYQVTRVDVGRDLPQRLAEIKPDACFNALHGRWGEDGAVQGLLEVLGIPYTHSGVLASSLAMHKERAKAIIRAAGVPVAEGRALPRDEALANHAMAPPYVAKPISEGSSVGVVIVMSGANRPPEGIAKIPVLNGEIMVEQFVAGKELTCGVIDGKPTEIIDIVPSDKLAFYDYEAKYAAGGSVHILPAALPADVYRAIQAHTLTAHNALGCRGVSRADFRYDPATGTLICMEVNTQPGMTSTSLVPELAANRGLTYPQLCALIIEDASLDR